LRSLWPEAENPRSKAAAPVLKSASPWGHLGTGRAAHLA
jgi:hypothetical protein